MAKELNLTSTTKIIIVTREEVSIEVNKISIDSIIDSGNSVTSKISFFNENGYTKQLVLWEGEDYLNIGDWTDSDVNSRILELLNL
jgi:hypothetical protein